MDLLQGLTTAFSQLTVELVFQEENFISLNTNIAGLTPCTTEGLVNHDSRMTQAAALAFGTSIEQKSAHTCCQTNADRVHIGLDVLHRIENAQTVIHRATW